MHICINPQLELNPQSCYADQGPFHSCLGLASASSSLDSHKSTLEEKAREESNLLEYSVT